MKRFIVYVIEIILCYVLQSAVSPYIELANIIPNFLIILVVSTAYMRGRTTGLLLGLFSGLLLDLTFGSLIGLYGLIYMLVGYFFGYSNRFFSNEDYTLPILLVAAGDFVYNVLSYMFMFLLRGRLDFLYYLRRIILPEIVYTVAISVLLYKLLHMINNKLDRRISEEA